jgi:Urease beta subunit
VTGREEAGAGLPGEIIAAAGTIELNAGRDQVELLVENGRDRPIQVGCTITSPRSTRRWHSTGTRRGGAGWTSRQELRGPSKSVVPLQL